MESCLQRCEGWYLVVQHAALPTFKDLCWLTPDSERPRGFLQRVMWLLSVSVINQLLHIKSPALPGYPYWFRLIFVSCFSAKYKSVSQATSGGGSFHFFVILRSFQGGYFGWVILFEIDRLACSKVCWGGLMGQEGAETADQLITAQQQHSSCGYVNIFLFSWSLHKRSFSPLKLRLLQWNYTENFKCLAGASGCSFETS